MHRGDHGRLMCCKSTYKGDSIKLVSEPSLHTVLGFDRHRPRQSGLKGTVMIHPILIVEEYMDQFVRWAQTFPFELSFGVKYRSSSLIILFHLNIVINKFLSKFRICKNKRMKSSIFKGKLQAKIPKVFSFQRLM